MSRVAGIGEDWAIGNPASFKVLDHTRLKVRGALAAGCRGRLAEMPEEASAGIGARTPTKAMPLSKGMPRRPNATDLLDERRVMP